jgi:hypothetical protein
MQKQPGTKQQSGRRAVSLNAVSNNQAHANPGVRPFTISDPTIRALNQRAAGYDVPLGPSGILGMPKRKYGFAMVSCFSAAQQPPLPVLIMAVAP